MERRIGLYVACDYNAIVVRVLTDALVPIAISQCSRVATWMHHFARLTRFGRWRLVRPVIVQQACIQSVLIARNEYVGSRSLVFDVIYVRCQCVSLSTYSVVKVVVAPC
jgi:hypothetical protein